LKFSLKARGVPIVALKYNLAFTKKIIKNEIPFSIEIKRKKKDEGELYKNVSKSFYMKYGHQEGHRLYRCVRARLCFVLIF